ncbi:MAG: DUF814 domain-containing protein [bacterium]|nr:DUF814 domain-containing protein [bacterium]
MRTDALLIRRLAFELDTRFRGAKVRDVGVLPDGRTAIALWSRGQTSLLCIDLFGTPPLVSVEDGELPIAAEPGFVRATGAALRGMALLAVRARKGDRLLRLTFGVRSRFGVGDEVDLFLELVPRFGNAVLVKRDTVVAAAKEFSLAENGTRAVAAGLAYQLPPLAARPSLGGAEAEVLAESEAAMREPLYAYRRDGAILQVYPSPLAGFDDGDLTREPSLLALLGEVRAAQVGGAAHRRAEQRRRAFVKRLDERERKVRGELASIAAKRREADARETLRVEGDAIFATLYELPDDAARDEAKDRAAKLFARYKKLGASRAHLDEREATLRTALHAVEELRWEAERAEDADLDDVESALETLETRQTRARRDGVKRRKRAPLEVRTAHGSRILVGRSPVENAELTFHVARPHDLWFHAQNIPGAHVILQRDDRSEPPEADLERAAELAAFYSKAKASTKVPIDFTERKFVRAQRSAPPGLVWYTHPRTLVVAPRGSD